MPDTHPATLTAEVARDGTPIPGVPPRAAAATPWWSGIDTEQKAAALVVQLDLLAEDAGGCAAALAGVAEEVAAAGFAAGFAPGPAGAAEPAATFLVGISARLVKGPMTPWRDDSDHADRWGHVVRCPRSLRTMQAKRDTEFPAFATESRRVEHETDVCLLLESDDAGQLERFEAALDRIAGRGAAMRASHAGRLGPDHRDPFGFRDGISNLQYLRAHEPQRYLDHLFTRTAEGEVDGTYLVFRKYRTFPERLVDGSPLVVPGLRGKPERRLTPEQVIGRCRETGLVVHAVTGERLAAEPDERQGAHAFPQSHLHKANPRGEGVTNFGHRVRLPDARILRRSYPYAAAGERGLLFLAFQADIQDGGFEFIHNEWLMSDLNGAPDPLLAPESGLVEPLTGCYYFVPRRQDDLAGVLLEMLVP